MAGPPRFVPTVIGKLVKIARKRPDLTNVSSIQIHMCPWEKNSTSTKSFWMTVSGEKSRKTNRLCPINTNVAHDGSEPTITVQFYDEEKLCIHGQYLTAEEIMYHFNSFCINKGLVKKDTNTTLF
uniref:Large ribosomal subunit protein mL53 n=1 Tax=Phallusia mammillata TaxID=59560 RepID=A0A6F9DKL8_9ASCI|nr:39S ribosomal protein L53, mitochondrial-like [Phallusia mammillata]